MIKTILIAIATILLFTTCSKTDTSIYYPMASINGFNDKILYKAIEKARADQGILGIIIQRNNDIIVEEYFGSNSADNTHPVKSVTKSVTSLLFGLAIDKGLITNLDETIGTIIPEYIPTSNPTVANITIKNLLSMTGGFNWDELTGYNDFNNWATSDDHLTYAMEVPLIHSPGSQFTYTTPGCQILSAVFTKKTDYSLADFAAKFLYPNLEIEGERSWSEDIHGYSFGGVALNLKATDFLKIGELFLNKGMYNGIQILSENWVTESTSPIIATGNMMYHASNYGYLWWIGEKNNISYYFANGYGGQFIFIFPSLNMVVIAQSEINNEHRSSGEQWINTSSIIMTDIFNSIE